MTNAMRDADGRPVKIDDAVTLVSVPESLTNGLPMADQMAIRKQIGRTVLVQGFDQHGHVEVEFKDGDDVLHTIWLEPACLRGGTGP